MITISPFIRIITLLVLLLSPALAQAGSSPFSTPQTERYRINLISSRDWIEVNQVHNELESLSISFINEQENHFHIATFTQNGPSLPELTSIFKVKINSRQLIIAIVKWHYYLPGANTEGDYYEIHAYDFKKFGDTLIFSKNKDISDLFGSGFDGKNEGKISHFRFKNATAVRRAISRCTTGRERRKGSKWMR